ncbi:addiction module toxin RelE [Candidatus Woesearchaeota archaeon]|nr:addiction module toxin RelE [Candidatus Woesearchaeota archaeon]
MRSFAIEEKLQKRLEKIQKKDKVLYQTFQRKVEELLNCKDVNHYKNLRKPLQHLKRVHILGPFVLTFCYIESEDKIIFYDFDHHDNIYQ